MKSYPSIDKTIQSKLDIIAFDKLDGSNIRAEWSPKRGFYKFGSRKCLIDERHPNLGKAVLLIKLQATKLEKVFKKQKWQKNVVCFFEFWGPNSMFGQHRKKDEHQITLFDVSLYKQGLLAPREFIKLFGHLDIPKVLYEGRANKTLVDAVKNSTLDGMTLEGIVCKAPNPNKKKTSQPVMFKIKSLAWLEKLREFCAGNEALFKQLA
jgi:hypothetical protein